MTNKPTEFDLLAMLEKLVRAIDRAPANFADGLADEARELIKRAKNID